MTDQPPRLQRALECVLGVPSSAGNRVDVLYNPGQTHSAMLRAITAATCTVDLQTFGYWDGSVGQRFASAMAERARCGVRARVLLDALGTRHIDRSCVEVMEAAGVDVVWFRPLPNWRVTETTHRGHRRILVCDGRVAVSGGFAIADDWRGDPGDGTERRDTALRLEGPVVNGLRGAFVNNWAEMRLPFFDEDVEPLPRQEEAGPSRAQVVRGDAETGWGDISTLARALLGLARRRVRITADYFVPDPGALDLLCKLAGSGVTVELLRPGPEARSRLSQRASRACYERLLSSGVKVWEYQPAALEAKVMTVDGAVANVGPVDFDAASLTLNDEVTVVVFDPSVVAVLDDQFEADLARAEPVGLSDWRDRGRAQRAKEATTRFLARRL